MGIFFYKKRGLCTVALRTSRTSTIFDILFDMWRWWESNPRVTKILSIFYMLSQLLNKLSFS